MITSPQLDSALEQASEDGRRSLKVAAYRDGELIADAAIGCDEQTVYPVFSVGKGVVALAVHVLAARGALELEAPVCRYWPEYAAHGKESLTIRHVLSHRAGVPQVPPGLVPERLGDHEWLAAFLADVRPLYPPGTENAYLPLTFGWILDELVRRTDEAHRPLDVFVREELSGPLDVDAFWFGIPPSAESRVAALSYPDAPPPPPDGAPVLAAVPGAVSLLPAVFNRPDVHSAVIPAVGAIADARSLARLFCVYAGAGEVAGRRFISAAAVRDCLTPRPHAEEMDLTYGRPMPVGLGGLWTAAPGVVPAGRGDILAHPGAGGSVAWAELDGGLAAAICHDRMFASAAEHPDHPFSAIADAVRELADL